MVPRCSGADHGAIGQSFLQGGEDLDPLDRVDAEVGVELHGGLEDLGRIARLLRDHLDQGRDGIRSADASGSRPGWRGTFSKRNRHPGSAAEELGDLSEGADGAQVLRADHRGRSGSRSCRAREDLDPLDRVDPQIGVELHGRFEDLGRVSRLLRDDLHQDRHGRPGPAKPRGDDRLRERGRRRALAGGLRRCTGRGAGAGRPSGPAGLGTRRGSRGEGRGRLSAARGRGRFRVRGRHGGGGQADRGEGQPLLAGPGATGRSGLRPVLAFEDTGGGGGRSARQSAGGRSRFSWEVRRASARNEGAAPGRDGSAPGDGFTGAGPWGRSVGGRGGRHRWGGRPGPGGGGLRGAGGRPGGGSGWGLDRDWAGVVA